jgi:membrane associated rhomboid family serine protease
MPGKGRGSAPFHRQNGGSGEAVRRNGRNRRAPPWMAITPGAAAETFVVGAVRLSFASGPFHPREPMFPLYDDNPTEIFPLVTVLIMGACVAVWVYVQGAGFSAEALTGSVCAWGVIPSEITGRLGDIGHVAAAGPCPGGGMAWPTLVTSMFLHGSWMHLLGNLWFLWIFGNNVEDSMGHGRFLLFYLLAGLVASGSHIASASASPLPMVGASGAISAIMGAYLLLYPRARVYTLFIIIVIIRVFPLPAWFFLLYWFSLQVASSWIQAPAGTGGVAFWAHIGGFLAGLALVMVFRNRALVAAKRSGRKVRRTDLRGRGWW